MEELQHGWVSVVAKTEAYNEAFFDEPNVKQLISSVTRIKAFIKASSLFWITYSTERVCIFLVWIMSEGIESTLKR